MMPAADSLRLLYRRFNERDIDGVLAALTPDVDWPNGWEGGWVRGHDAVREYWTRQWQAIDPTVEPTGVEPRPDGCMAVRVHQVVRDLEGRLVGEQDLTHVFTLADGLVSRMVIEA